MPEVSCPPKRPLPRSTMFVYKIFLPPQWADFESLGVFRGAPIDLRDGYLHLSSAGQVEETANLHFADHEVIVVARIPEVGLNADLVWETSRGGAEFPHLYGELSLAEVNDHWEVIREKGRFSIDA